MLSILLIAWNVILPIFLLMAVGWGVQKKIGLDVRSLTKLNFWVFVPALLFVQIVESKIKPRDIGLCALHFAIVFSLMGVISWQASRIVRAGPRLQRALTASVLFYNSGRRASCALARACSAR